MWPAMRAECLQAGYREVFLLPVAGNAFVYRLRREPLPESGRFDVAFVSNLQVPAPDARYPGLVEEAERILRAEGIGYRRSVLPPALDRLVKPTPALLHWLSFDLGAGQRTNLRWARGGARCEVRDRAGRSPNSHHSLGSWCTKRISTRHIIHMNRQV